MRLSMCRAFSLMLFVLFLLVEHSEAALPWRPTNLTAIPVSSTQVNLSWIDNASNETGFTVMRGSTSSGPWSQIVITGPDVTSYANTGLSASTAYYYRVRASKVGSNSNFSNTATATTLSTTSTIPNAPNSLSASAASSTQINLSWTDNASNETGFKVERATISAGPWSQIATTGANVPSYANTGLSASTAYYYRVGASNAAGNSSYSNTASATTSAGADTTAPTVSTGLTASAVSCSQNNLVWAASTDNTGGSGLKGYNVYANGAFLKQVTAPATSDSGLAASTTFAYTVSAVDNASNESAQSTVATATTPACYVTQAMWSDAFGSTQDDRGRSVAIDQSGNVVMTGHFRQTVDFGGGPLTAAIYCLLGICNPGYPPDIFLAKVSPAGAHLWSKRIGGHGEDSGSAVAVDSDGDVLLTGTVGPNVDFGGGELPSLSGIDIFVAKYSGVDGSYRWARRFGSTSDDVSSYAIAVDPWGDVVITGQFLGTVDFGGGPLTSTGGWDIFVAKYSGVDGSPLWARRLGNALDNSGLGVAVDGLGNVVVTGYFYGVADFGGPAPLTSAGDRDIFLAKYRAADGAYLWAKQIGSAAFDHGNAVAVDSADNILLTGSFVGTLNFGGPGSLSTPTAINDVFVAKYTSSGAYLWAQRFGGTNGDWGTALAVDGSDNVVVTGAFQGTVDFGNGPLTSAGSFEIFVLKLPPTGGTPLWSRRFGSTGDERSLALAAGPDGSVAVTGYFPGTVNFGDGPLTSAGSSDIFLLRIAP
jgi:Fibronectin type III domain